MSLRSIASPLSKTCFWMWGSQHTDLITTRQRSWIVWSLPYRKWWVIVWSWVSHVWSTSIRLKPFEDSPKRVKTRFYFLLRLCVFGFERYSVDELCVPTERLWPYRQTVHNEFHTVTNANYLFSKTYNCVKINKTKIFYRFHWNWILKIILNFWKYGSQIDWNLLT